jgi:hypothetical protein
MWRSQAQPDMLASVYRRGNAVGDGKYCTQAFLDRSLATTERSSRAMRLGVTLVDQLIVDADSCRAIEAAQHDRLFVRDGGEIRDLKT